jgi:hypothetical protein
MARSVNTIYTELVAAKEAESALDGLTSTSVTAAGIAIHEQYFDSAIEDVETLIAGSSPNSKQWMRAAIKKFQYDATNAQTPTIDDTYNVVYPTVNEDYQIITRVAVTTELDRTVTVKVAKSEPPEALSAPEAAALLGYVNAAFVPGIVYDVISLEADKVYILGTVYFNPLYGGTISQDVFDALDAFYAVMADEDFDGTLYVTKLITTIKAVTGVVDFALQTVKCRPDSVAIGSATVVYDLATGVNNRSHSPLSGYFLPEDTASYEYTDTITFAAM